MRCCQRDLIYCFILPYCTAFVHVLSIMVDKQTFSTDSPTPERSYSFFLSVFIYLHHVPAELAINPSAKISLGRAASARAYDAAVCFHQDLNRNRDEAFTVSSLSTFPAFVIRTFRCTSLSLNKKSIQQSG